ncbi:MAG: glycoside hydrolase family 13 protein [Eubacteriales bacterium]|nr:glycoside hydrolase family 13 protein [Eubacteriales bacterium]
MPTGEQIRIRFLCDEAENVTLRTWNGVEHRAAMKLVQEHLFEAIVTAPQTPLLLWYDFIIHRGDGDVRYGTSYDQLGGVGAFYHGQPQSYQVTVYQPDYQTPDYLRHGIIYQIFPDRFYKDKHGMSGRVRQVKAAHPEAVFHESWDELPNLSIDSKTGDNRALDFFGGTLKGIVEKLDDLRELGVTILYINPVFRARTNHRYDTGSYEEIDPILGDDKAFDALIKAAGDHGMKVMMDGVFSHTGSDSKYFNRYGRYDTTGAYQSKDSPYYPWYSFSSYPDRYNCWWGFETLPAVDKNNEEYRRYLLNADNGILPGWVKRGACGWRLDVADELPVSMLREMRTALKTANPEAVLLGEVWEDASNKIAYGQQRCYCLGDTLDSVMNYPLRHGIIDFFTGKCDAYQLRRVILHQQEVYPAPFYYSLMNLLGSHDRVRILNAMVGYDREGIAQMDRAEAARIRLTREEANLAQTRVLEAFRLLCALPGAPTIYYGDEIGMQGMADPWNRAPMDWAHANKAMRRSLQKLLLNRRENNMLQTGYLNVEAEDENTLVIRRYAVDGKDVFGQPLPGRAVTVRIKRK